MHKYLVVGILIASCVYISNADEEAAATVATETKHNGRLHKTITRIDSAADKVPGIVKSINDGIEVRVENIVQPIQHDMGAVRGVLQKAIETVGGYASKVRSSAADMGRRAAEAVRSGVNRSIERVIGRAPVTPAIPEGPTEPTVEAAAAPEELVKDSVGVETTTNAPASA